MDIIVPMTVGSMQTTMLLTGTTWIAKGASGSEEFAAFYKGATEKGWIFTDPRAAKVSPGQAKAMVEMYAAFVKIGGIPYETNIDIKPQGEGSITEVLARMGGVSTTTTTHSVETSPLADDLFQPPVEYKLEEK